MPIVGSTTVNLWTLCRHWELQSQEDHRFRGLKKSGFPILSTPIYDNAKLQYEGFDGDFEKNAGNSAHRDRLRHLYHILVDFFPYVNSLPNLCSFKQIVSCCI